MTDEQLQLIEARVGVAKTMFVYPGMWQLDTQTVSFIHDDAPALVAEVKRLREAVEPQKHIENADLVQNLEECVGAVCAALHFEESLAKPQDDLNRARVYLLSCIASLEDENAKLRDDISRLGAERDQMVAANVELQKRLSKYESECHALLVPRVPPPDYLYPEDLKERLSRLEDDLR
jgi:hypothetical protein